MMDTDKKYNKRTRLIKDNIDISLLGSLISQKRKAFGLRGTELAKLIGVSPQTLNGYEKGYSSVSAVNLIKLCLVFDCGFMDFKQAFKFSVHKAYVTRERRVVVSKKYEVNEITFKEKSCTI